MGDFRHYCKLAMPGFPRTMNRALASNLSLRQVSSHAGVEPENSHADPSGIFILEC
jgi:hypothetical protein